MLFRDWGWDDDEGKQIDDVRLAQVVKAEGIVVPEGRARIVGFTIGEVCDFSLPHKNPPSCTVLILTRPASHPSCPQQGTKMIRSFPPLTSLLPYQLPTKKPPLSHKNANSPQPISKSQTAKGKTMKITDGRKKMRRSYRLHHHNGREVRMFSVRLRRNAKKRRGMRSWILRWKAVLGMGLVQRERLRIVKMNLLYEN
jgi:hypothetical protein